jgi:ribonuclease T2
MRRLLLLPLILLAASCRGTPPPAIATLKEESKPARTRARAPGRFDFYVLSLSWSPGFCATPAGKKEDTQCGPMRSFAFVLHGLWPQYEEPGWPSDCPSSATVGNAIVEKMLPIMPSSKLVRHEWAKHGTCSGLTPRDYFEQSAEAFNKITIPEPYRAPLAQITVSPASVQSNFAAANPDFPADSFVVLCSGNGRFLQEVRACLTKDLDGRPCNREVQRSACRSREVIMRPVR